MADFPKGAPMSHIELGISATVDFSHGVMKFEAQVSPNSYLFSNIAISPAGLPFVTGSKVGMKVTGCSLSVAITPSHYPNHPRLSISWQVNPSISITGAAYFAITPLYCMCGGRWVAALNAGPLRAWFIAHADFLINYKPFTFIADGSE